MAKRSKHVKSFYINQGDKAITTKGFTEWERKSLLSRENVKRTGIKKIRQPYVKTFENHL